MGLQQEDGITPTTPTPAPVLASGEDGENPALDKLIEEVEELGTKLEADVAAANIPVDVFHTAMAEEGKELFQRVRAKIFPIKPA